MSRTLNSHYFSRRTAVARIRQQLEYQLTHANSQTVGARVGDIQLQGVSVVWDESVALISSKDEQNRCACPGDLNRLIRRARIRVS